jgi:hypothetical protein
MFCAICIDGTDDLQRGEDGCLECARCRTEHPIYGGYAFDGGRDESQLLPKGNSRRSSWSSGAAPGGGKRSVL